MNLHLAFETVVHFTFKHSLILSMARNIYIYICNIYIRTSKDFIVNQNYLPGEHKALSGQQVCVFHLFNIWVLFCFVG